MACGCDKARKARAARRYAGTEGSQGTATQTFSLVLRDGSSESFGSRLEADAANARAGYTGTVRQNSGR